MQIINNNNTIRWKTRLSNLILGKIWDVLSHVAQDMKACACNEMAELLHEPERRAQHTPDRHECVNRTKPRLTSHLLNAAEGTQVAGGGCLLE